MSESPANRAEGLIKNFGKTQALAGLDLAVPAGTVYGLLGPNGAGKTTAVRVFATLLRPDGGRAQARGGGAPMICSSASTSPRPPPVRSRPIPAACGGAWTWPPA